MSREKYVFKTQEIAHLWVHSYEQQGQARNPQNNLYFTGDTIYSYRDSYPIARDYRHKTRGRLVLIQEDRYSNTTAKHIGMVRQAVRHLASVDVPYFPNETYRPDKDAHERNCQWFDGQVEKLEAAFARARSNTDYKLRALQGQVDSANRYAVFFGLRRRWTVATDTEAIKAKLSKAAAKVRRENARKRQEEEYQAKKSIQRFRDGVSLYGCGRVAGEVAARIGVKGDLLRVVNGDSGLEVETSRGARFPVEHARRGVEFVRRVRESGQEWTTNGHTFHLGVYALDKVSANGDVKAGCHNVAWEEIERLAGELTRATGGAE